MREPTPQTTQARQPERRSEATLQRLDARVVHVWRAALLLRTIGFAAAAAGIAYLAGPPFVFWLPSAAVGAVGLILVALLPPRRYAVWGFRVGEDDLFLRRGVLWRTHSVVPLARIQHVDTRRGPLERTLGLARVVVFTAGFRGAELTIPGLATADAESLRDRLAALSGAGDAV